MSDKPSVLGIDVGTSGCKATLINHNGRVIGSGYASYEVSHPAPAWAEIDPDDWLAALQRAVGKAARSGTPGIAAIGISSANATVMVDKKHRPVMRAVMQLDRRSASEIAALRAKLGDAFLLERTGNTPGAGVSWLSTLAWLRRWRPYTLARTRAVVFPGGYVALKLTGVAAVDPSRASTTGLFCPREDIWCPELAAQVGVETAQLPVLAASNRIIGRLRRSMATALGLRAGVPVVAGTMDSAASALSAGAVEPGDAVVVLGTMARSVYVTDKFAPSTSTLTARHALPDRWIGMNVLWGAGRYIAASASLWSGRPDYVRLAREVLTVAPGCDGLRFNAPAGTAADPLEKGLRARRSEHTPAHVARAVIEGVLREIMRGSPLLSSDKPLAVSGGPTRSPAVTQILADMTGRTVAVQADASEAVGAAICAAAAAGISDGMPAAISLMSRPTRLFMPSPVGVRAYEKIARVAFRDDA